MNELERCSNSKVCRLKSKLFKFEVNKLVNFRDSVCVWVWGAREQKLYTLT